MSVATTLPRVYRAALTALAAVGLCLGVATPGAAQGVTSAAIRGVVRGEVGEPLADVEILATNGSTGQRFAGRSRADGRFNIENVAVGGPYTVEARLIGRRPVQVLGVVLTLGQATSLELTMPTATVELTAITVSGAAVDPLTSVSRTGSSVYVSDTAIARLPTLNRNFTDFVLTLSQAEGTSIGGQHNRLNNVQIDGVSNNDLFGLGATGQPGGQVDAKSISLEAVREYQVLIAPFDVRQGGFAGGLVNAVTRTGTNRWRMSLFEYHQNEGFVGRYMIDDTTKSASFGEYQQNQYGFSVSGPLRRDRAHFIVVGEWQGREFPSAGNTIGRETDAVAGIATDSATRLVNVLQNTYNSNAGSFLATTIPQPNRNFFARVDVQLNPNHTLTIRDNYVSAEDLNLSRSRTSYRLSSNGYRIENSTNSLAAQLNSTLGGGRYYNELRIGYQSIRDRRNPEARYPELSISNTSSIGGSNVSGAFIVGAERFSQANELDQGIFELTDDLTFTRGAHTLTVGTHNEFISFRNLFFPSSTGFWSFGSIAALEAGTPTSFSRTIPYSDAAIGVPGGLVRGVPVADWNVSQFGLYAQDQWSPSPRLVITAGLRFDIPTIPTAPTYNGAADTAFSIRTDAMPSGNILWSPRLGFNWAPDAARRTVVRGGTGVFTGRPA